MAIDTNVSQLIINELTQEQYNEALAANTINDNELYLIKDDETINASEIAYNNANGMVATDVQSAIDELKSEVSGMSIETDAVPTDNSANPVQSGGVYDALSAKQDELAGTAGQVVGFDANGAAIAQDLPIASTSASGIMKAGANINITADGTISVNDASANQCGVTYLVDAINRSDTDKAATPNAVRQAYDLADSKQEKLAGTVGQVVGFDEEGNAIATDLTIDAVPEKDSTNPVQSAGVYAAVAAKQNIVTGLQGQIIGFDQNGEAVAQDETKEVFVATYGTTTYEEIQEAYSAGRVVCCQYGANVAALIICNAVGAMFSASNGATCVTYVCSKGSAGNEAWSSQETVNQVALLGTQGQVVGFDESGNALAQNTDAVPTEGSANPVQSGGVFAALEDKQDKITGAEGQVVGFDADGNAVAQNAPTSAGGSAEWRLAGSNTNCKDAYITNDPDDTFTLELDEEVDFSSISEFILIVGAASWTGTVPSNWSARIVDQAGNGLPGVIVLGSDSTVQYRTWVHAIKCGEKWMGKVDSWETTGSAAKFSASYQATSATTVTAIKFVAPVAYEAKISNYSFVRLFVR